MSITRLAEWMLERNHAPDVVTRAGVRHLLSERLKEERGPTCEEEMRRKMDKVRQLRRRDIAVHQEKANEQHYELPTEFFLLSLGARRKYSSCYFETKNSSLDEAEESMLRLYCQRAGLRDGMKVLDLGCGWGSLTLYIAQHYPGCSVTALSNSWTQRHFIEAEAKRMDTSKVKVITADVQSVDTVSGAPFDIIFSIEMVEHMKNYHALLEKISRWLRPDGKLFVHYFCHSQFVYEFETEGASNFMGRNFFTGGTMPSDDLFTYFQDHLRVVDKWRVDGRHYAQTSELWLAKMDRNIEKIRDILRATYGTEATKMEAFWRTFYIAVAETFGYNNGQEWFVAHYLFEKQRK